MNRIFKQLAAVLLALVLLAGTALAALPDRLIPGGQAIGLQLQTDGVSIVELAQDNPCAREAGLRRGDVIRAIDGVNGSAQSGRSRQPSPPRTGRR